MDYAPASIPVHVRTGAAMAGMPAMAAESGRLLKTVCSNCNLRTLCLPSGLEGRELGELDELIYTRRRVKAGETIYQAGAPFRSLYAVRSGFFKSYMVYEDGRDQVTGFQMAGEIIGLDGIDNDRHTLNVIALEDSEVCVIPYLRLEEVSARVPHLRRQIHKTMSREIVREHGVMILLGSMRAEERVAAFLLNLSKRFLARGYAASQFNLRMTREDIGSYLGIKLETVSRVFSKFDADGLLSVQKRLIRILDVEGLKRVLGQAVQ
jgi:CRP/FNR family transcriptional regulator